MRPDNQSVIIGWAGVIALVLAIFGANSYSLISRLSRCRVPHPPVMIGRSIVQQVYGDAQVLAQLHQRLAMRAEGHKPELLQLHFFCLGMRATRGLMVGKLLSWNDTTRRALPLCHDRWRW